MAQRILIIGGVAGGATAAARARRLSEAAEITLIERGPYVSYANCGLPYFIGGEITDRRKLLLQTPEGFRVRYGVDVLVNTEAIAIDRAAQTVTVRGAAGEKVLSYDALVLAQGGNPVLPQMLGADAPHVFKLWTVPDTDRIHGFIAEQKPKTAVVVGGGFIGLEMAEAFRHRGLETTVVEFAPTVLSVFDAEIGRQVQAELAQGGVSVRTSASVVAVHVADHTVELSDGTRLAADLVLFSVGVRPELSLARAAGLELGPSGGLLVDDHLRTSDPHIWAAGDMVEVTQRISGRRVRVPLAGPANRQGRIAVSNAMGHPMPYRGVLGTSVVKVFEATVGMSGLSEKVAREAGFDVGVAVIHKDDHAGYYPGGQELSVKLIYDRQTSRLLGGQVFGHRGVDKRADVIAMALQGQMHLSDLAEVDLAYAPPYSSANDPVNLAAFIAENDVSGYASLVTAPALLAELAGPTPPLVLDVRTAREFAAGHLVGAVHIPVDDLRGRLGELPQDRRIVVQCRSGFRAHLALRMLRANGFADVVNITGGWVSIALVPGFRVET